MCILHPFFKRLGNIFQKLLYGKLLRFALEPAHLSLPLGRHLPLRAALGLLPIETCLSEHPPRSAKSKPQDDFLPWIQLLRCKAEADFQWQLGDYAISKIHWECQ